MVKPALITSLAVSLFMGHLSASACACQGKISLDQFSKQEAEAARRLPSESDRNIAREFRNNGMFMDAAHWYRQASDNAAVEVTQYQEKLQQQSQDVTAPALEQLALHSAGIHREASSFFRQCGKVSETATTWEQAIAAEIAANKQSDLATEYATIAKLYESAGQPTKAAAMYKKQIEILAASKGRYSREASLAQSELKRLNSQLSYTLHH